MLNILIQGTLPIKITLLLQCAIKFADFTSGAFIFAMYLEQLKTDLERIAGKCEMKSGETMTQVLARLDTNAHLESTPAKLKHYLLQRSYIKALAWIEDPRAPHQV
mgnify:CR=1 FL=1